MSTEHPTDQSAPGTTDAEASAPACSCWSRRESLKVAGVAVAGAAGLAACGSSTGDAVASAASGAASAAGGAIAEADIPVGGGKVFDALKVVVTQPTAGRLQGVLRHLHAPGVHGQRRVERRHHLPLPRLDVRHRDRRGHEGPGHVGAARQERLGGRGRHHRHLSPARPPPDDRVSAGGRRVAAWLTRRRTVLGRARSRPTPASTGSATRTAGSSTSARPRACGRGCPRTSRTSRRCTPARPTMVRTGASVEWTVVATEVEALQLEYSWIKEFDPRFNVKYRDDKSYPYLAVTLGEEFPRAQVMRGAEAQGHPLLRPLRPRLGDPRDPRPRCCASSRCAPARPGSSSGPARSAGPACSATSTSAARPASAGSTPQRHREIAEDFCDFMAGETGRFMTPARA